MGDYLLKVDAALRKLKAEDSKEFNDLMETCSVANRGTGGAGGFYSLVLEESKEPVPVSTAIIEAWYTATKNGEIAWSTAKLGFQFRTIRSILGL
jgi:hypothetical protein